MDAVRTADVIPPLNDFEEKHAPDLLFLEGNRDLLQEGLRVSVVGSRKPSEGGIKRAAVFCRALVRKNIIVVSGLAQGIDTVAHQTALQQGGRTIAVLGTPLSQAYPASNKHLLDQIKRYHLAVSQFPEGY
ncbi:MAG: DNA-processing protein DprA, partial [Pseudomonadota bacterium]